MTNRNLVTRLNVLCYVQGERDKNAIRFPQCVTKYICACVYMFVFVGICNHSNRITQVKKIYAYFFLYWIISKIVSSFVKALQAKQYFNCNSSKHRVHHQHILIKSQPCSKQPSLHCLKEVTAVLYQSMYILKTLQHFSTPSEHLKWFLLQATF